MFKLFHCFLLTSSVKCFLLSVNILHFLKSLSIVLLILFRFHIWNKHVQTKHFFSWIVTYCQILILLCYCYSQHCLKIHITKLCFKAISFLFHEEYWDIRSWSLCVMYEHFIRLAKFMGTDHTSFRSYSSPSYIFFMLEKLNLFIKDTRI